jgi:hypothetical protein
MVVYLCALKVHKALEDVEAWARAVWKREVVVFEARLPELLVGVRLFAVQTHNVGHQDLRG